MNYGVVPEGFRRKTVDNIIDEMQGDQLSTMHDDLDVSDESVLGQQNAIVANQLGEGWEQLEQLYNCGDPDAAEDRALENLCKQIGVFRAGDTKSTVLLHCTLVSGTTLTPSEQFAQNRDQPDIRWTPVEAFTAPSSGIFPIIFEAENAGPIEAVSDTVTAIATPVVGWSDVSQPNDAEPGVQIEDDTRLRQRRLRELATMGSATTRAIAAKLSAAFPGAASLAVFENDDDVTDSEGRPPHSVEALIYDGDVPPPENDDIIAKTIADSLAGGIRTVGNSSGVATVLDGTVEVPKTFYFSRPDKKNVYLAYDIVKAPNGYPGDEALKAVIAQHANELHLPGVSVAWSLISSLAFIAGGAGVARVPQVRLGFTLMPTDHEVDLPIALREIARFDTANIVINILNA